jgi:hypothetical protein
LDLLVPRRLTLPYIECEKLTKGIRLFSCWSIFMTFTDHSIDMRLLPVVIMLPM